MQMILYTILKIIYLFMLYMYKRIHKIVLKL
jgi:hypothetical protein